MADFTPAMETWCTLALILAGLAAAWLARVGEGSRWQAWLQRLFLGCLAVVALVTLASVRLGPGYCLVGGAALAIMVVAATWDFGSRGQLAG